MINELKAVTAQQLVSYMAVFISAERLIEMTLAVFNQICSHLLKFSLWYVETKYLK